MLQWLSSIECEHKLNVIAIGIYHGSTIFGSEEQFFSIGRSVATGPFYFLGFY